MSDEPDDVIENDEDSESNTDKCPICMDEINDDKNLVITECKHKYHFICMIKFAKSKFNKNENMFCPMCKQTIINNENNNIKNNNVENHSDDDSDDDMITTFVNTADRNSTMTFQNRRRYLGNTRASGNNSLVINMDSGLWEESNDINDTGNYLDNTSDVDTNSTDEELEDLILTLASNI